MVEGASSGISEQEGQADIPIFIPVPFKDVSSITPYSLDEQLWQLADRLMEQYQRHFMIRIPGQQTKAAVTPFVKSWYVRSNVIAAYRDRICNSFLPAAEVDRRLFEAHNRLAIEATGKPLTKTYQPPTTTVESEDIPPSDDPLAWAE